MKQTIPLSQFAGSNALLNAYATQFARVAPWFHYDPFDAQALARRIADLEAGPLLELQGAQRGPLVAALVALQQRWGAGAKALAAARQLGRERTFAVVTGQQAGLFGGPLYTMLKALTVIKLARQFKQQMPECHFVPLFWIASGDSDYEEIRHCYLPGPRGAVRDLALQPEPEEDRHKLLAARDATAALAAALEALEQCLPAGPHQAEVMTAVRAAYCDGNLVDGFARWMARLFQDTELVLVDFQDPVLKSSASAMFRRFLTGAEELEQRLNVRDRELEAAGFARQVQALPGDTVLFYSGHEQVRDKIARAGADFQLRSSGRRLLRDELLAIAANSPEWIVPGVMSLPLCQHNLFPMAAWVGGGAELAYRAQATAVYDFMNQQLAPAFFRASATLLSGKEARLLTELGWELPSLYTVPQDVAARAMEGEVPEELGVALAKYREVLLKADAQLLPLAEKLDPNLAKTFATFRDNLDKHADKVEKKIISTLKSQRQTQLARVEQLHLQVYPMLSAQERVLSVLGFLPRYGFKLVERLLEQITVPNWEHQVIILD